VFSPCRCLLFTFFRCLCLLPQVLNRGSCPESRAPVVAVFLSYPAARLLCAVFFFRKNLCALLCAVCCVHYQKSTRPHRSSHDFQTSARPVSLTRIFLYLFCHYFPKINGRIKIFEKCTFGTVPHGGRLLPPHPHSVKSLPSWGTAAGAWFRC
jgi:hypothetical protein